MADGTVVAAPAPARASAASGLLGPLVLFGLLAAVPLLAKLGAEGFIVSLMTRVVVIGLAALSLDLLIGFGGLISFGHAAFLGIGAYAVGILSAHGIDDLVVQLGVAVAASVLFALASGAITLRTQGVYFIMITLAFGQMLFFLATSLAAYGGDDGMTLSGRSLVLGQRALRGDAAFYYLSLGFLLAAYVFSRRLVGSRFGRVLRGAKENEVRMEAVGFEAFRYRLVAYAIAGAMTGIAGVLLANQSEFVSPAVMSWQRSGDLIFMVVLGGLGTLHGAIVGAAVLSLTEELLSHVIEHWRVIFGPLLILAVLFARGGLVGLGRRRG